MTSKEAFIKEYRSVYLEDPNFENVNDLDLYSWWQWACDWQKAQDVKICEKVQSNTGDHSESGCYECGYEVAAEDCADLIRDQDD